MTARFQKLQERRPKKPPIVVLHLFVSCALEDDQLRVRSDPLVHRLDFRQPGVGSAEPVTKTTGTVAGMSCRES